MYLTLLGEPIPPGFYPPPIPLCGTNKKGGFRTPFRACPERSEGRQGAKMRGEVGEFMHSGMGSSCRELSGILVV